MTDNEYIDDCRKVLKLLGAVMENAGAIQKILVTEDGDEDRTIRFQIVLAGHPDPEDRRYKTALHEFIKFNRAFHKGLLDSGHEQIQALVRWASSLKPARKDL